MCVTRNPGVQPHFCGEHGHLCTDWLSLPPPVLVQNGCYVHDWPLLQDHALPFCADPRHAPDTLFLIAEEDWRLRETDCVIASAPQQAQASGSAGSASSAAAAAVETSDPVEPAATLMEGEPAAPSGLPPAIAADASAASAWSAAANEFWEAPRRPRAADAAHVSESLQDIVRIITFAHRQKVGDLVWLCWQPHGKGEKASKGRAERVRSGAMSLALSQKGARQVLDAMTQGTIAPGHFDVALVRFLELAETKIAASYLHPPMGSYLEHPSGCDPSWKHGRPGCWNEAFACPGSRPSQDPKRRRKFLGLFRPSKGPITWTPEIPIESKTEDLRWLTFQPEPPALEADPNADLMDTAMPASMKGRKGKGKGKQKHQEQQRQRWFQPLPAVDAVAAETEVGGKQVPLTARQERERRTALRNYARRVFTNNEFEATCGFVIQTSMSPPPTHQHRR